MICFLKTDESTFWTKIIRLKHKILRQSVARTVFKMEIMILTLITKSPSLRSQLCTDTMNE